MRADELSQRWRGLTGLAFEDATEFLTSLTRDPVFLATQILPLLGHIAPARGPSIAATFGAREASTCLQVFVWAAGATTAIHDHTSWGAYHCVVGSLHEERYARLDEGEQPNSAHLRRLWRRTWRREDGATTVGAYEQGIHRISNPWRRPAISLHLYGPRTGAFDGRDYDPRYDFVCDRLEEDALAVPPAPLPHQFVF